MGTSNTQIARPQLEVFPLVTQILVIIFSLIAFILSAVTVSGCHFFEVSSAAAGDTISLLGGLFKYDRNGALWDDVFTLSADCTKYPDQAREWTLENDASFPTLYQGAHMVSSGPSFKAAQAMGAIGTFAGGLTMIACFLMIILHLNRCAFKTLSGSFFFCFATQLFTFLVLDNDVCNGTINEKVLTALDVEVGLTCDLSTASHTAIAASVLYLVCAMMTLVCPTPKTSVVKAVCGSASCDCCEQSYGGQQVSPQEVQQDGKRSIPHGNGTPSHKETYNPHESATIQEERINPDGSRSIAMKTRNFASI